ncbi:hypothetical protein [Hymenobacter agri]
MLLVQRPVVGRPAATGSASRKPMFFWILVATDAFRLALPGVPVARAARLFLLHSSPTPTHEETAIPAPA